MRVLRVIINWSTMIPLMISAPIWIPLYLLIKRNRSDIDVFFKGKRFWWV